MICARLPTNNNYCNILLYTNSSKTLSIQKIAFKNFIFFSKSTKQYQFATNLSYSISSIFFYFFTFYFLTNLLKQAEILGQNKLMNKTN